MKILTRNQQLVLQAVTRSELPPTVAEIAEATWLSTSSTRGALSALERYACVERRGVSMSGGATYDVPRDVSGLAL